MSSKAEKKLRKAIRGQSNIIVNSLDRDIANMKFKDRLTVALSIIFKKSIFVK